MSCLTMPLTAEMTAVSTTRETASVGAGAGAGGPAGITVSGSAGTLGMACITEMASGFMPRDDTCARSHAPSQGTRRATPNKSRCRTLER